MDSVRCYSYLKKICDVDLVAEIRPRREISDHLPLLVEIDMGRVDDNPWIGVLTQPQGNSAANIISYLQVRGNAVRCFQWKIQGVFARTDDVNRSLSLIVSMEDLALGAVQVIEKLGMVHRTPDVVLLDADDMYKVDNFRFEVRSDRYRFRLLTAIFGPLYPAVMSVDRGVCNDLAKSCERFNFSEGEPCEISIEDDDGLDRTFRLLLDSEKLNYICDRLMNEPKNTVGQE